MLVQCRVFVRVDFENLMVNQSFGITAEVEISVVGRVEQGRLITLARVTDGKLAIIIQHKVGGDGHRSGIAVLTV